MDAAITLRPSLAFVAGVLSILSPCVLPLLPLVLGAAAARHRYAPLALAVGVSLAFVVVGLLIATLGYSAGLDFDKLRIVAAVLIIAVGAWLLTPWLQLRVAEAASPLGNWADRQLAGPGGLDGFAGQFVAGLLLGAVWSPCVGPTLGAASLLAAQGRDRAEVAMMMLAFGLGAAVPLLLIGMLSRQTMQRWRGRLLAAGGGIKLALGIAFVLVGVLAVSGLDKAAEAWLVDVSPDWLTRLTTQL
jgi:cytochrome c-type biogenesis protein